MAVAAIATLALMLGELVWRDICVKRRPTQALEYRYRPWMSSQHPGENHLRPSPLGCVVDAGMTRGVVRVGCL